MLTHKGTQTIETPRLILRRAQAEDAQPMFKNWASAPNATKFMTWPTHSNVEVTKTVLQQTTSQSCFASYSQIPSLESNYIFVWPIPQDLESRKTTQEPPVGAENFCAFSIENACFFSLHML